MPFIVGRDGTEAIPQGLNGLCAENADQLGVLNRDDRMRSALSASFTLQAVRLASRLICVGLQIVSSVL